MIKFIVPFDAGVIVRERGKAEVNESGRTGGGGRKEGERGAGAFRVIEVGSREGDASVSLCSRMDLLRETRLPLRVGKLDSSRSSIVWVWRCSESLPWYVVDETGSSVTVKSRGCCIGLKLKSTLPKTGVSRIESLRVCFGDVVEIEA